jgi:phosphoglycolate phosphatase
MVGDTVFDILGAAEHHIPTVAVSWGYGHKEDLQNSGAIAVADNAEELYNILNN